MTELGCDAVLFDLDGVLVDSTACIERHWRRWAAERDLDADEIMRVAHGRPTVETIRLVAPHLAAEQEAARLDSGEAFDTEGVAKIEGAAQLVRSLPTDAWAVVTSGTRDTARTRLTHTGVPVPSVLVTADDVKRGKPHPEGYLLAAVKLDVRPDRCIVIEDAPAGIGAAHAAGMRVVAVTTTHCRGALAEADAIAGRLRDVQISQSDTQADGRLMVRIGEPRLETAT
jgi:sugar-phosphatase